ncbi:MAG: SDR family NAD(P)-dependent oxidoreductase [Cyclobacteriaceae bacterium]
MDRTDKLIAIVGAGPGISQAVAHLFGMEGYAIALIARSEEKLKVLQSELFDTGYRAHIFIADAANRKSLKTAFKKIEDQIGEVSVLLYNAARLKKLNILEESFTNIADDLKINLGGAMQSVKSVITPMKVKDHGTLLFTGGGLAIQPYPDYGSLSIGKAAIRSYVQQLAHELRFTDIKVGTVTIRGFVTPEDEKYNPAAIAKEFWKLHCDKEKENVEIIY